MCMKKNITKRQRIIFLDVLRTTGNISASSRAANINSRAAHFLKIRDLEFSQEWDLAKDEALDELEAALRKRAIEGVEKPVYYAGKECGVQRSYSDSVGMYILKTHRGEGYADVNKHEKGEPAPLREISARERLLEKLDGMARNITDKEHEQSNDQE
jgi:hypothetical protein